ncbi:MAG: hypothetical protein ACT4QF_02145 [Sporichthyaceae bacterium]
MPTTPPPGQPPGHEFGRDFDAEALSRVLDGRAPNPDASAAELTAQARAEDDVDALRRAFALMGDVLADDAPVAASPGPGAAAAAGVPAVLPAGSEDAEEDDDRGGAVVLPFAARLRQKAPILAAAASLVAVVGFGAVLVGNGGFEGSGGDSSSVAQAPTADVPAAAAPEAAAPEAVDTAAEAARSAGAAAPAADKAAKASKAEKADEAAPASGEALSGALQSEPQPKSPASTTKSAPSALDAAVACNRGIFVGTVLTLVKAGEGYQLTVAVTERIDGGNQITFQIGRNYAETPQGRKNLTTGQEFLFVVPKSSSKAVYAFPEPSAADREKVADARQRQQNADC